YPRIGCLRVLSSTRLINDTSKCILAMIINKLRKLLEYLLVFCIIIEFYTPYLVFPPIKQAILISPCLILLCLITISNYSLSRRVNLFILIYLIGALIPMILTGIDNYPTYIIRFIILLPAMWIYLYLRKGIGYKEYLSLFFKFSNTVTSIAVISLIMWFLCSILQILPATALIPFEWSPKTFFIPTYLGIYFETQTVTLFGTNIWRNSGIFNEGPMFNMVLCIAFSIEYFMNPQRSKIKLLILTVTIISTFTTTGQFFLIGIMGLLLYTRFIKKYKFFIIIMTPIIIFFSYLLAEEIIDNKRETSGEISVVSRTEDIQNCIEVGVNHPIFGIGITSGFWHGQEIGFSNSLFSLFARGGLYTLALYLGTLIVIPFLYSIKYKNYSWLLAMLSFFVVFTITSSILKYLTFLFIAWGLSNIDLKKKCSYKREQLKRISILQIEINETKNQ
ncbi:O-antigen ligase family protein, partial [Phocaeicola barnesiae]|uniref:O-antigen ligase family protein n=1 Tax=Phocaeicola barnesiae TaxID=376804 RepID=UPI00241D1FAA